MPELDDVHLRHQIDGDDPVHAVAGVTLDIEAGELVALYLPSGSGKASLLQIAAGLLRTSGGHVRVAGRDVSLLSEREAARHRMHELGFLTQSFDNLLPGASVLDSAALKALGRGIGWREARPRVTPLLDRLGLGEKL